MQARRSNRSSKVPNVKIRPPPQESAEVRERKRRKLEAENYVREEENSDEEQEFGYEQSLRQDAKPLEGLVFTTSAIVEEKTDLVTKATTMGAIFENSLTKKANFLLTIDPRSIKVKVAVENDIKIVKPSFIYAIHAEWQSAQTVDLEEAFQEHRLGPITERTIAITCCSNEMASQIRQIASENSAHFAAHMSMDVNYLIVGDHSDIGQSSKVKFAQHNKVQTVWSEWLFDSIECGYAVDTDPYKLTRPKPLANRVRRASRPTPSQKAILADTSEILEGPSSTFTPASSKAIPLARKLARDMAPIQVASEHPGQAQEAIETAQLRKKKPPLNRGKSTSMISSTLELMNPPSQPIASAASTSTVLSNSAAPSTVINKMFTDRQVAFASAANKKELPKSLSAKLRKNGKRPLEGKSLRLELQVGGEPNPDEAKEAQRVLDETERLERKVFHMGGTITEDDNADFVVLNAFKPFPAEYDTTDMRVVSDFYLGRIFHLRTFITPDEYCLSRPLRVEFDVLEKLPQMVVGLHGFDQCTTDHMEKFLKRLHILKHQRNATLDSLPDMTHLMIDTCIKRNDPIVAQAKNAGVKIVAPDWIYSIARGDPETQTDLPIVVKRERISPKPKSRSSSRRTSDKVVDSTNLSSDGSILKDCTILFGKNTQDRKPELVNLAGSMGAQTLMTWSDAVTHLITTGLSQTSDVKSAKAKKKHIVHPAWLTACFDQQSKVEERNYPPAYDPNKSLPMVASSSARPRSRSRSFEPSVAAAIRKTASPPRPPPIRKTVSPPKAPTMSALAMRSSQNDFEMPAALDFSNLDTTLPIPKTQPVQSTAREHMPMQIDTVRLEDDSGISFTPDDVHPVSPRRSSPKPTTSTLPKRYTSPAEEHPPPTETTSPNQQPIPPRARYSSQSSPQRPRASSEPEPVNNFPDISNLEHEDPEALMQQLQGLIRPVDDGGEPGRVISAAKRRRLASRQNNSGLNRNTVSAPNVGGLSDFYNESLDDFTKAAIQGGPWEPSQAYMVEPTQPIEESMVIRYKNPASEAARKRILGLPAPEELDEESGIDQPPVVINSQDADESVASRTRTRSRKGREPGF